MDADQEVRYLKWFTMPNPVRITGRSSSITNSFVNGIIPVVAPTEAEVRAALEVLGMLDGIACAYCGDPSTEWDHLRPLVVGKRPTGYISETQNLVPACGKCNQSKGNKPWRTWMHSSAPRSPKTRGIVDLEDRTDRLGDYEAWGKPTRVDFEVAVGARLWELHWRQHAVILNLMREAEGTAQEMRKLVRAAHDTMAGGAHDAMTD